MAAHRPFLMPAVAPRHHQAFRLDIKSVMADGTFEGYASLFNREDLGRDIILPGAFRDSLRVRGAAGVKMLFQHDPSDPIGIWEEIREDSRGLFVRGRLTMAVSKAREVLASLKAGALDGLSIGFKVVKGRRDARTGVRRLAAVDLWEISIVTFPMLPDARIISGKRAPLAARCPTERDIERWLTRDAGLSRVQARALICGGFAQLKALRDAGIGNDDTDPLTTRLEAAAARIRAVAAGNRSAT